MKRLVLVGDGRFRTFRNLWALEELTPYGIQYEQQVCMPRSTEATEANPFGKIPSLIDHDIDNSESNKPFVMYESAAINTYLGDKYRSKTSPQFELVPPAGTTQRGLYEQVCYCIMTEVDAQGLWIHRKHESLAKVFGSCPEAVDHAFEHTLRMVRTLAMKHLLKSPSSSAADGASETKTSSSSPYLLGESFTAADILFVHCLDWADRIGWMSKWLEDNSNDASLLILKDVYLPLCKGRPAYQRAMKISQENSAQNKL